MTDPKRSRARVAEAQNWRCAYCAQRVEPEHATIDHVIPRGRGGPNSWENRVMACQPCNEKKGQTSDQRGKLLVGRHEIGEGAGGGATINRIPKPTKP